MCGVSLDSAGFCSSTWNLLSGINLGAALRIDKEVLMNAEFRRLFSAGLLKATLVSALLFAPIVSQEQTFFGSGGSSNTATDVTNLAFGFDALFSNTTGEFNTAIGYQALYNNTIGVYNTAVGYQSLYANTEGMYNTANGRNALF